MAFKSKALSLEEKMQFISPQTKVENEEQIDPQVIREIQQTGVDNFIANLNLSSLFQNSEPEGGLKAMLPWIQAILLVIVLIVTIIK